MSNKTWEEHWATGETPWDAGQSAPSLSVVLARLLDESPQGSAERRNGRAFVPGCGAGHDVLTLAKAGYRAIGLDIAPSAHHRFATLRTEALLSTEEAELIVGDFFVETQEALGGPFDLMWDYTFFCAIEPHQRDPWKTRAHHLLRAGGTLAMLLFPVSADAPLDQGPPYPLDPHQVAEGLSSHFQLIELRPAHASHPGREGKEWVALFRRRGDVHETR